MERSVRSVRWGRVLAAAGALALAFALRRVLWTLTVQLAAACLLLALALPLCRWLEKRMKPGLAASLSLVALGAVALALLLGVIPPLVGQFRLLSASLPELLRWGEEHLRTLTGWLERRGVDLLSLRDGLLGQLQQQAAGWVSGAAQGLRGMASSLGVVLLSPLIAYYLLRDRKRIAAALTLLVPVRHRARTVRALREMRRETAGFLRGQLVVSGAVGALTALGLLLIGSPGWLLWGLLMGIMEVVPYVGPWIAGVPAVLFSLQGGLLHALWTLAVIVTVQQLEGGLLSPRLLSGATRLHPLTILLTITAGGVVGGAWGMILSIPLVVSTRGALRGLRARGNM